MKLFKSNIICFAAALTAALAVTFSGGVVNAYALGVSGSLVTDDQPDTVTSPATSGVGISTGKQSGSSGSGKSGVVDRVSISIDETIVEPGNNYGFSVRGVSGAEIKNYTFDTPVSEWQPGHRVKVTFVLAAVDGLRFDNSTEYAMSKGTFISGGGEGDTVTAEFYYTPKSKLNAPKRLKFDTSSYELTWNKVENAGRYQVRLTTSDGKERLVTVNDDSCDTPLYIDEPETIVSVGVRAMPSKGSNSHYDESPESVLVIDWTEAGD